MGQFPTDSGLFQSDSLATVLAAVFMSRNTIIFQVRWLHFIHLPYTIILLLWCSHCVKSFLKSEKTVFNSIFQVKSNAKGTMSPCLDSQVTYGNSLNRDLFISHNLTVTLLDSKFLKGHLLSPEYRSVISALLSATGIIRQVMPKSQWSLPLSLWSKQAMSHRKGRQPRVELLPNLQGTSNP